MGRFWEDFKVSDEFTTAERTITESDVLRFAGLSGDLNPIHTDLEYCRSIGLPGLVPQTNLVIALASGLIFQLGLFDGTGVGLRSVVWRTREPIELGETIRCRIRIAELREVDARHGVLVRDIEVLNQRNQVVHAGSHELVMLRRPSLAS
jgi:acyl dehydratase